MERWAAAMAITHPRTSPASSSSRSLSAPDVFEILSQSELTGPIQRFQIPSANRRHFASMSRFPDGLLPLGDSICIFDPAFGQGMAVAAMEAESLADSLASTPPSDRVLRREYFRRTEALIDIAWNLSTSENFKYPQTTGPRPVVFPLTRLFKDALASSGDSNVIRDLYRVATLVAPP